MNPVRLFPFLLLLVLLPSWLTAASDRPNIVLVLLDDVGTGWIPPYADRLSVDDLEPEILEAYTRVHGHQGPVDPRRHIETARESMPHLARLAEEGRIFDRAFATASLCSPSRAGLLTGSFQQRWGAYWNKDVDDHGIPETRTVIAEPLKAAGYRTGIVGKWHVGPKDPKFVEQVWTEELGRALPVPQYYAGQWPKILKALKDTAWKTSAMPGHHPYDRGFDYYFGYNSYDDQDYNSSTLWEGHEVVPPRPDGEFLTDLFNEKANAFVERSLAAERPFFLYYAPKTLHGAIRRPPEHYVRAFDSGNVFTDEYAGHLLALDRGIGLILETLRRHGQADNTLFLFSSDNGCTLYHVPPHNAPNRGGKGTGWLGGLNVPLVAWQPGRIRPGTTDEIVSLADLMPTILEAAGADVPPDIDGRSLLPFLHGETMDGPRDGLASASIHSSRWHYFYAGDGENNKRDASRAPLYAWYLNEDNDLLMLITETRAGLYSNLPAGLPARTLFYDIADDRDQRHNLADREARAVQALKTPLHRWLQDMAEPLTSQQADYRFLLETTRP
ncbi:MAG: sulfatase family protein [Opitutales bacterium]